MASTTGGVAPPAVGLGGGGLVSGGLGAVTGGGGAISGGGGAAAAGGVAASGAGGTASGGGGAGGFGLEEIGIPGRDYLREALTSCQDPLKAIEDFQIENGVLLPSLRPMLPLLDLHGIKRLDFHNSVLEDLRDKLVAQIGELGNSEGKEKEKKLRDLLSKSFPVIQIKEVRPVVMSILKNMSYIEDRYLRFLVRDKDLYADCDIEIKRHLWRDNQSLFGDEVSPLLSQYIKDKENVLFTHETGTGFFNGSPKSRRQSEVIQKLAEMIGTNVKLYDMTLQFLRTLFLRTKNVHYCTLRSELLMALHDREVQDVISVDPCHKFTWCLDACIRERNVDVKRSRELQGFLDAIRRGQEQVLGDLSMTLCDPYAINFLSGSAMKLINHQVEKEGLPRDQPVLHLLLRMLALGLSAWEMIDSQDFHEPKIELPLLLQFIPAMMSLIVDDQVRALNYKFPVEDRDTASIIIDHSGPPPDMYDVQVSQCPIATTLAMQYTLQTTRSKDKIGVMRVLGILAQNIRGHPFEDAFLHSLVTSLIAIKDEFENEDFCTSVFDEFFFTCINVDNVNRHLMRLLWWIHPKLPVARIDTLLKVAEPTSALESSTSLYETLKNKMLSRQASMSPQQDSMAPFN